jgi:SP family myo-inositol transporter-like MFS transporter 13
MIAGLSAMSFCFLFIKIRPAEPADDEPPAAATAWSILALASMVLFCCFYALGPITPPHRTVSDCARRIGQRPLGHPKRALLLQRAERSRWAIDGNKREPALPPSLDLTTTQWLANLIVAATFLHLVQLITTSGAFALYAVLAIAAWFFVYLRVKETAGLSIEECRKLFEDGPSKYADYQAVSLPHETDGFGGQEDADRDTGLK